MTDDQIVANILRAEGGFVQALHDHGGATNFGITQATLSQWIGRDATVDDVRSMPVETAKAIYLHQYVRPFDGVDPALKPHVVDIAVNSGVLKARQLLALAEQQTQRPVAVQLVVERIRNYARIVRADPTQGKFVVGWIERALAYL